MDFYKITEVQVGFMILVIVFFSLLFSNVNVNLSLTHGLIIIITSIFLGIALINLLILTRIPHMGNLTILYKKDNYFFTIYKQLFFYIYFFLSTILVGLFAEILGNDRGQDILLVAMFATSIYYLIISISCTYCFIYNANVKENLKFVGLEDI